MNRMYHKYSRDAYVIPNLIKKIEKEPMTYPNFCKSRICIYYAYYEREYDRKNLTNLMFFIKYAVMKTWMINPSQIDFVFLINGELGCLGKIPDLENVFVLYLKDVCTDFHAWEIGIRMMEERRMCYDYIVLMNCSVFGPILSNGHWLLPFFEKLVLDEAVVCSPSISYLSKDLPVGEGPRVVSTFMFFRWNNKIRQLLMEKMISSIDESSRNIHKFPNYLNTVIGFKKDKTDAILTGEYGISRMLLKNGYKLTCLLYPNIHNFDDPILYNTNNCIAPDRYGSFFGKNIPFERTIFIKNIWRISNNAYDSIPIYYDECIQYRNNVLNMKNIFDGVDDLYWDFDSIPSCMKSGSNHRDVNHSWNSKKEYYQKYGRAEEIVIFPLSKHERIAFIFITNKYKSIGTYLIEMIQTLMYLNYRVVLGVCRGIIVPKYLECVYGYESKQEFWAHCTKTFELSLYLSVIYATDEVIFPVHGVLHMKKSLEKLYPNSWKFSNDFFENGHGNAKNPDLSFVKQTQIVLDNSIKNSFENYLTRYI